MLGRGKLVPHRVRTLGFERMDWDGGPAAGLEALQKTADLSEPPCPPPGRLSGAFAEASALGLRICCPGPDRGSHVPWEAADSATAARGQEAGSVCISSQGDSIREPRIHAPQQCLWSPCLTHIHLQPGHAQSG